MGALAEFLGTLSPRLALLWWWLAPRREAGSVVDSQQADEAAEVAGAELFHTERQERSL